MQKTDNSLDFALSQDSLFFAVNTPNGVRLTKDGSFMLNDEGILVTKQGYEVLPADYFESKNNITFNTEDAIIEADKNGRLYNSVPGSAQLIQNNMLMVVAPENMQKLKKEGDNLFIPESIDSLHVKEESGALMQGFVEKSNVNPINEMIAMIEANRLVGMYQKAMDSQMNDLNRDAVEKIARNS
jgi:flagellar basal-body rod protein FlgG